MMNGIVLKVLLLIGATNSFWTNYNFAKPTAIYPWPDNTGVRQQNWGYHSNSQHYLHDTSDFRWLCQVWINKIAYLQYLSQTVYGGPNTTSDSLNPSEKVLGPDGQKLPEDIFGSRLTANAESVNIQKPFYKPTIQNSTSLRMCREYFKSRNVLPEGVYALYEGVNALPREFPHLAILGFGDSNNITWGCGGSLISDQYVLTAAYCITPNRLGRVRYVRLGELNLDSTEDDANVRDFTVADTITHPLYNFISGYHDIALIRLNETLTSFNEYISPACLATTRDNLEKVVFRIAGWGRTEAGGSRASILQTAKLKLVPQNRCQNSYRRARNLRDGRIDDIHICADGRTTGSDACRGDSGGPLQFINNDYSEKGVRTFIEIAGVVSFGLSCGEVPGVYTRVLPYEQWIESKVWPGESIG